jgi:hypothetical protein
MSSETNLEKNITEAIIDNIILDKDSTDNDSNMILFSALRADATPVVPFTYPKPGIEYPQFFSAKCAICNSPHRQLLEHVYIDSNKKILTVQKFFERHFQARLNWSQIKQHVKHHCDFNSIEYPGMLDYESREEEFDKWKYNEHELAFRITLTELNDVRGLNAKSMDEVLKRSAMIDKLTKNLLTIKEKRDSKSFTNLPSVFEVLLEVHNSMVDDEDKRIIREKVKELKQKMDLK